MPNCPRKPGGLVGKTRALTASFVLWPRLVPRAFVVVADSQRRSLILLKTLQMRSLHRSWDSEIDGHFGGTPHLCYGSGCGESRIVGFVEDFAIGDEASENGLIGPSVVTRDG
jgi:hypothetical protein